MDKTVTEADMTILRKMAGCHVRLKAQRGYRNWYPCRMVREDVECMERLLAAGYVQKGEANEEQRVIYFHATEEGCRALKLDKRTTAKVLYVGDLK